MEDKFETFVKEAIDKIPKKYQEKMKHVAILVDDQPTMEQRRSLGLRSCDALYGLYEGVPLTARNGTVLVRPPDKITIFKHPMIDLFTDDERLRAQIQETLWHEVAHFFGLNHAQIHQAKNKRSDKR